MSVTVNFYSFAKRTNSTKLPTTPAVTLEANIKAPSSLLNPVLELATDPTAFNYCYIESFNRYYFVGDIEYNRGLWIVPLSVDVLASYKADISNYSGYILRSASARNEYLSDAYYTTTGKLTVSSVVAADTLRDWDDGIYVVNVVSGSGSGTVSYQMSISEFSTFYSRLNASVLNMDFSDVMLAIKNEITNPIQYVTGAYWFPHAFSSTTSTQSIDLGPVTVNVSAAKVLSPRRLSYELTVPKHPQASSIGKYCNYAPYSSYSLTWGPLGSIALDPTAVGNADTIILGAVIDAATGQALISASAVSGSTNKGLLFECVRGWGVPVRVSAQQGDLLGSIIDTTALAASYAAGAIAGPAIVAATGAQTVNSVKNTFGKPSSVGSSGSLSAHNAPILLEGTFLEHPGVDIEHNGRPLCEKRTISGLSGFVLVQSADLDINCTASERSRIKDYLEGGFYYE